jgi:hypothetical protein
MAAPPTDDPRGARWEARLRAPVLVAALAVLPLVGLSLTHPHGTWHAIETAGHLAVWLTFAVEVAIMLAVVADRRAWIRGHRFELLVVAASSPVVPLALAVAPALRLLVVAKLSKTLKLAKAVKLAKLGKSLRLVRRKVKLDGAASAALGVLALGLAVLTVVSMVTEDPPLQGGGRTVALVVAGMLATFGVNHLRLQAARS